MIHIVQCLCPQRHCIMAVAYDDVTTNGADALEQLEAVMKEAIERHMLNPWCGICQSRDFFYEDGVTRFTTMEEARPHLERSGADQIATRAVIDELKASRN
jgi:hypothetical protein